MSLNRTKDIWYWKKYITSTLWIRVSSRSSTRVYNDFLASPSSGGKNGGVHFGKFVKLFGNLAVLVEAIADAFRIANGFLPVSELAPAIRLLVPLVFVLELIAFD